MNSPLYLDLPAVAGRMVTAVCDGGDVPPTGKVLLLKQADTQLGLTARLSTGVCDAP